MASALFISFDNNLRREYYTNLVKAETRAANPVSLTLFGEITTRYTPPADASEGRAPFPKMNLTRVVT